MSREYISKLADLDPERGDTMIFKWSDAIGQLTAFPSPDKAGRVIQSFITWGKGGAREQLKDPWENAVLQNMIDHQIEETKNYFRTCHNKERKELDSFDSKRGEMTRDNSTKLERTRDNTSGAVNKTKEKENEPKGNSFSFSEECQRDGLTPSADNSLSEEDARKTVKQYVPDKISGLYGFTTFNGTEECPTDLASQWESELIEFPTEGDKEMRLMGLTGIVQQQLNPNVEWDDDSDKSEKLHAKLYEEFANPLVDLAKTLSESKEEKWELGLAKAFSDALNPETTVKGKPIKNKEAFVMARMKAVTNALQVLDKADSAKHSATPHDEH